MYSFMYQGCLVPLYALIESDWWIDLLIDWLVIGWSDCWVESVWRHLTYRSLGRFAPLCALIDWLQDEVTTEIESMWRHLAFTSQGCFAPLCAFLGGVVAQEVLKALTGKFMPLKQWVCNHGNIYLIYLVLLNSFSQLFTFCTDKYLFT